MVVNVNQLVFRLLIILICFIIFQLVYRINVWVTIQTRLQHGYTGYKHTDMQSDSVTEDEQRNQEVVDENIKNLNNKEIYMYPKKQNESASSITNTSTTNARTIYITDAPPNVKVTQNALIQHEVTAENDRIITDSVQVNISEDIARWRSAQENQEALELENALTYDGRDLLQDPQIQFDSNFKNPCWFDNSKLHCLPYVYIIGVKKCGTSDLFYRMSLHPDFINPGFKEAQWFARNRFKPEGVYDDIREYIGMFKGAANDILNRSDTSGGKISNLRQITGEGSPSNLHLNMHWKHLPGNERLDEPKYVILDYIHHYIPQAKIIITFRDPVDRLYSDYYHEYGTLMETNRPSPLQFHEVVTEGVNLYQDCFRRHSVRSCVYEPSLYEQTKIQIQLGIYYIFWQDLTRLFPRRQILVLQNKHFGDKENTMRTVYEFLTLRTLSDEEMETVTSAKEAYTRKDSYKKEGPMLQETMYMLRDFYRPFNKLMSEITADDDFLYEYASNS